MILEDNTEYHYQLMTAKCAAMICMFIATALLGSVPYILNCFFKWSEKNASARSTLVIQCLLHFGGGVLLATTLVHLLPEVEEVVAYLQNCGNLKKFSFPLAELLMCVGFFLMYLIEEMIHGILDHNKQSKRDKNEDTVVVFKRGRSIRNSVLMKSKQSNAEHNNSCLNNNSDATRMELNADLQAVFKATNAKESSSEPIHNIIVNSHGKIHSDFELPSNHGHCSYMKNGIECPSHSRSITNRSHVPLKYSSNDNVMTSSLRGLFIVLALSLHEIFEGLAIGLEDNSSSVWFLFAAVSAHKLVLAFCIGVELLVAHTRSILAIVYTLTFAIVSPVGIFVGILISNTNTNEQSISSAILQGLACGTLLYVVFFEILSKHHCGFAAYATMLLGFGLMLCLQQLGKKSLTNSQ